ncbi:hypothetical protein GCU67_05505 [Modestobacter muralis]|uniref:EfeO-type cupredoxin-like domain-containing protein n=1 Tax=Modestobacter muralis TaxID=1608614 RepID=A0A6P0H557_9ACTN|nr:hypothetical protein [Modestobacter muralis]NEN50399.1 hypothetical protein [Modestobacter muralis]
MPGGPQQSAESGWSGRKRAVLPAVCGLALVLLTGCGSSAESGNGPAAAASSAAGSPTSGSTSEQPSGSSSAAASPSSAETVITIEDFAYGVPESVSPGATVTVMNMDSEAHTVTADEGDAFDAVVTGSATGTFTAPTTPGSYPFFCAYHSNMRGVLVVR